jgi:hypothetical protein
MQIAFWRLSGELTLRLREECDLAEPEDVRGVLDAAAAFILAFNALVGCTKSPTGCRRCDERCGPGGASILKFSDRLSSAAALWFLQFVIRSQGA